MLADQHLPEAAIVVTARQEQRASYGQIHDRKVRLGQQRMAQSKAKHHHDADDHIASPGLKGENTRLVRQLAQAVDILASDFGKAESIGRQRECDTGTATGKGRPSMHGCQPDVGQPAKHHTHPAPHHTGQAHQQASWANRLECCQPHRVFPPFHGRRTQQFDRLLLNYHGLKMSVKERSIRALATPWPPG
jgi:hypothetical protein